MVVRMKIGAEPWAFLKGLIYSFGKLYCHHHTVFLGSSLALCPSSAFIRGHSCNAVLAGEKKSRASEIMVPGLEICLCQITTDVFIQRMQSQIEVWKQVSAVHQIKGTMKTNHLVIWTDPNEHLTKKKKKKRGPEWCPMPVIPGRLRQANHKFKFILSSLAT